MALMRHWKSQDFICEIVKEVQKGHGFVPMIGSGMSAPSGILMGMEFTNFLAHTVYHVIQEKWNLREHGWPRYPVEKDIKKAKDWITKEFQGICKAFGYDATPDGDQLISSLKSDGTEEDSAGLVNALNRPLIPAIIRGRGAFKMEERTKNLLQQFKSNHNPEAFAEQQGYSRTSQSFIKEKAIRSLHDWRATLQFLAQVDIDKQGRPCLKPIDPAVIDSFNTHITRDKQANLSHKMLAHLSRPMRIRTVLTTNFDTLIEDAFSQLQLPLKVLPVSIKGNLPDPKTVRSQNCIIKLHGELLETRADYSLDDEPEQRDKRSFARYVRGEYDGADDTEPIPNHMLVVGYSASDARCVQMVKYLLDKHDDVTVFWICFNKSDVFKVQSIFNEPDYQNSIQLFQTTRSDLLLYELYQELTLCLPAGGFAYEFTHKVPPEPREFGNRNQQQIDTISKRIFEVGESIDNAVFGCDPKTRSNSNRSEHVRDTEKVLLARSAVASQMSKVLVERLLKDKKSDDETFKKYGALLDLSSEFESKTEGKAFAVSLATGAAQAMRAAFQTLTNKNRKCIWLELQDYSDVATLGQEILRIISLRIGEYQLQHVVLMPSEKLDESLLKRHLKRLMQFFRESPSDWIFFLYGRGVPGACAGWLNSKWKHEEYERLQKMIQIFSEAGFNMIYMPLTTVRTQRDEKKQELVSRTANELGDQFRLSKAEINKIMNLKEVQKAWEDFKESSETRHQRVIGDDADTVTIDETFGHFNSVENLWMYDTLIDDAVRHWIIPDTDMTKRDYLLQLKFLYATTLFRQSRHTSAFFSDAVYSCPYRFNTHGRDNDWVRGNQVRGWIRLLRRQRVFYYKPGGYCWKHRDIRLGLQTLLQGIPFFETTLGLEPNLDRLDFIGQMRARAHFWIGDWYFKAFAATGHSIPVLESLYHRFKCAQYASSSKPSALEHSNRAEIAHYRFVLFRSAVMEMIKTMRVARPWMKFWLSNVGGHPMFSKPDVVIRELKTSLKECKKASTRISRKNTPDWPRIHILFEELRIEMQSIQKSLCAESGSHQGKIWSLPSLPAIETKKGSNKQGDPEWVPTQLGSEDLITFDDKAVGSGDQSWQSGFEAWFKKLELDFLTGIGPKSINDNASRQKMIKELNAKKMRWLAKHANDALRVHRAVDLVADYAYLYIRRARMEHHVLGRQDYRIRNRWCEATIFCFLGLELCRHLHPSFWEEETQLKIKLHTLYGLALSHLSRFYEAHRHVNEATSLLSKSGNAHSRSEFGIIRLRRAEIYLVEAEQLHVVLNATKQAQGKFKKEMKKQQKPLNFREFVRNNLLQLGYTDCPRIAESGSVASLIGRKDEDGQRDGLSADQRLLLWLEPRIYDFSVRAANRIGKLIISAIQDAWTNKETEENVGKKLKAILTNEHCQPSVANLIVKDLKNDLSPNKSEPFDSARCLSIISDAFLYGESAGDRNKKRAAFIANILVKKKTDAETNLGSDATEIVRQRLKSRSLAQLGCLAKNIDELAAAIVAPLISIHPLIALAIEREGSFPDLIRRLDRLRCATLDDAWVSLESAERLMSGRSHSSLWWGRLATLKLRAYAAYQGKAMFESLVFRRKVEHDEVVQVTLNHGILTDPSNVFRKLRFFDCVSEANAALRTAHDRQIISRSSARDAILRQALLQLKEELIEDVTGNSEVPQLTLDYYHRLMRTKRVAEIEASAD